MADSSRTAVTTVAIIAIVILVALVAYFVMEETDDTLDIDIGGNLIEALPTGETGPVTPDPRPRFIA